MCKRAKHQGTTLKPQVKILGLNTVIDHFSDISTVTVINSVTAHPRQGVQHYCCDVYRIKVIRG